MVGVVLGEKGFGLLGGLGCCIWLLLLDFFFCCNRGWRLVWSGFARSDLYGFHLRDILDGGGDLEVRELS